jgi:hypothetical protein
MTKLIMLLAGLVVAGALAINTAYAQTSTVTVTPTVQASGTPSPTSGAATATLTPTGAQTTPAVLGAPNTGYGSKSHTR